MNFINTILYSLSLIFFLHDYVLYTEIRQMHMIFLVISLTKRNPYNKIHDFFVLVIYQLSSFKIYNDTLK